MDTGLTLTHTLTRCIVDIVCQRIEVEPNRVFGRSRLRTISWARAVCWYVMRETTTASFPEMAEALEKKCHSSAIHAVSRVRARLDVDDVARRMVGEIIDAVLGVDRSQRRRLVIVESPYAGDVARNVRYARACLADCLRRGEAPFASHLLYTQDGVLDDDDPEERALGIDAGLSWGLVADATVLYGDLGISDGMQIGVDRARQDRRQVEVRTLGGEWGA